MIYLVYCTFALCICNSYIILERCMLLISKVLSSYWIKKRKNKDDKMETCASGGRIKRYRMSSLQQHKENRNS